MILNKKAILSSIVLAGLALGPTVVSAESIGSPYSVKAGDNLFRIALNHGVSLEELTSVNQLSVDRPIHPGQSLIVPERKLKESNKAVYGAELTASQYETLLAVVQQESGGQDYEATLAVVSVMTNRVDNGSYGGKTIWEVITSPGQFEAFGANHYTRHLGHITEVTKQAVKDGLAGKKNLSYLNFWTDEYAYARGVYGMNIGGNVFFNL